MSLMKIAVDARALGGRLTGDRTYWRGLIGGLADIDDKNDYVLFVRTPLTAADQLTLPDNFRTVVLPAVSDRVWSLLAFPQALKDHRAGLAHVQYTVPFGLPCPAVTTVHDISFKIFPELFSFKDRLLLNLSIPGSLRRAKAVITVSENSRKDILAHYRFVSPSKITATPLAVGPEFHPINLGDQEAVRGQLVERYNLGSEFILSVGVLQPRKNLPMLIRAFVRAKERAGFPHRLAIAGKVGWLSKETEAAISEAGPSVVLLGYVPDGDLPLLYGCADLMAYPSLYEGFGLPPLEAMACGCPVIVSNNSSLPEVVGDAGILLPANDSSGWEDAIIQALESASQRNKMRTRGIKRASTFSWQETARRTLGVYLNAYAEQ